MVHQRTTDDYTQLQLLRGKSDQQNASTVFGNNSILPPNYVKCRPANLNIRLGADTIGQSNKISETLMSRLSCRSFMSCRVRWENDGKCTRQAFSALPAKNLHDFANPQTIAYLNIKGKDPASLLVSDGSSHTMTQFMCTFIPVQPGGNPANSSFGQFCILYLFKDSYLAVYLGVYRCKLRHTLVSLALTWLLARLGVLLGPNGPNLRCITVLRNGGFLGPKRQIPSVLRFPNS